MRASTTLKLGIAMLSFSTLAVMSNTTASADVVSPSTSSTFVSHLTSNAPKNDISDWQAADQYVQVKANQFF